jgi:hypothetical protein
MENRKQIGRRCSGDDRSCEDRAAAAGALKLNDTARSA